VACAGGIGSSDVSHGGASRAAERLRRAVVGGRCWAVLWCSTRCVHRRQETDQCPRGSRSTPSLGGTVPLSRIHLARGTASDEGIRPVLQSVVPTVGMTAAVVVVLAEQSRARITTELFLIVLLGFTASWAVTAGLWRLGGVGTWTGWTYPTPTSRCGAQSCASQPAPPRGSAFLTVGIPEADKTGGFGWFMGKIRRILKPQCRSGTS
jgi:hypothetical protein